MHCQRVIKCTAHSFRHSKSHDPGSRGVTASRCFRGRFPRVKVAGGGGGGGAGKKELPPANVGVGVSELSKCGLRIHALSYLSSTLKADSCVPCDTYKAESLEVSVV